MIDRDRYHESQDYRDGYDHGLIDGKHQVLADMTNLINLMCCSYQEIVRKSYNAETDSEFAVALLALQNYVNKRYKMTNEEY